MAIETMKPIGTMLRDIPRIQDLPPVSAPSLSHPVHLVRGGTTHESNEAMLSHLPNHNDHILTYPNADVSGNSEGSVARSSNGAVLRAPGGLQFATHNDDLPFPEDDDLEARMTVALDEHLQDHTDMATLYQQKLSVEGTSPKPCIVPGNALQLIDDNPAASRSHTPSSVIILDDDEGNRREISLDSSADQAEGETGPRPVPRVRFRSRVRITSGLRRSKYMGNPTSSPSSSVSGSPSSSISAPIRWHADENGAWGPLGRRISAYAQANGKSKRTPGLLRVQQPPARAKIDERTPLMKSNRHIAYVDSGLDGGGVADDERAVDGEDIDSEDEVGVDRAAALKREEDATFGQWPWRLLNRHWWWWHFESLLCICCPEDSDFEDH